MGKGKPFSCAIRIIGGAAELCAGEGFANGEGLSAVTGGHVPWSGVQDLKQIDQRAGGAATGMLAGGAVGLLGGPVGAAIGAGAGAIVGMVRGAVIVYAVRLGSGADLLVEVPATSAKAFAAAARARPPTAGRTFLPRWRR